MKSVLNSLLIVDDDESVRDILSRRLEGDGYAVAVAESGPIALKRLRIESFDLILLDIMMPGMDGYEVLMRLKGDDRLRHIPVLMISAVGDRDAVVDCIQLGAADYVLKPVDMRVLRARIWKCLDLKVLSSSEQHFPDSVNIAGSSILVVDDDEDCRRLLADRVRKTGHRPTCAADGQEALHLLVSERFDLVLLDLLMSKVDGRRVLESMKADRRLWDIPVIVVSAIDDALILHECFQLGAEDYVTKPYNAVILKARIETTLKTSVTRAWRRG